MRRVTCLAVLCVGVFVAVLSAQSSQLQTIEQAQALIKSLTGLTDQGVTNQKNILTRLDTLKSQIAEPVEPAPVVEYVRLDEFQAVVASILERLEALEATPDPEPTPTPEPEPEPTPTPEPPLPADTPPTDTAGHPYYAELVARPDFYRAYSLRSQAQIEAYRRSLSEPSQVTYTYPNDPDPRKQDAAKLVITGNSLKTQVWLPLAVNTPGRIFVTWDAWFGREFDFNLTGIGQYKTFQFGSPGADIWTELNTVFNKAKTQPNAIAMLEARYYGNAVDGWRGPNVIDTNPLSPQTNPFAIGVETWTRFFALFETDPATGWDLFSLWAADASQGPTLIFDRLQLKAKPDPSGVGRIGAFRLEYNTSTTGGPEGRAPLVGYFRNFVVLKPAGDISGLLIKP